MTRTVPATTAKNTLGELLRGVRENGENVIIEIRREPVAVLVTASDFAELQQLRKERMQREAIEEINQILSEQAERNKDLTDEQAQALVDRAIKDIREDRRRRSRVSVESR